MNKFVVEFKIDVEQCQDEEYLATKRKNADEYAQGREFIECIMGYQGTDFISNKITLQYVYYDFNNYKHNLN